ncbi:MAG: YibE/F family protein [Firmicutes bacterium]|nr:YibE/F family protein [Bacillota bacterium]
MLLTKYRAPRYLIIVVLLCLFFTSPVLANTPSFSEDSTTVVLRARVLSVEDLVPADDVKEFIEMEQLAEVEITSGEYKGQKHSLLNALMGHPYFDINLTEGSKLILYGEVDESGQLRNVYLQDYMRDSYLYLIAGLFIVLILLVGGRKGLITIITLAVTIAAVFGFLLPLLLKGYSPIPATVLVASGVTLFTLICIGGFHKKTYAAVIGTVGGVLVAGLLALYIGNAASLTGFSSEEAQMLLFMEGGPIDVRGLLFAGIIIGALGAVMDVAMSISAASYEVYRVNPAISIRDQITSGMNVGRAVMGTMANTLILAYVGASMPLLLLFMGYSTPYITIINMDVVATEVVRALAGSIGIIAAVPLTAISAGLLRKLDKKEKVSKDKTL